MIELYEQGRLTRYAPRHHRVRHLRRMDPNGVYYLVVGGASILVGVVVDALAPIPWWRVAGIGLVGAWAFTWLTALDDVRNPSRSLRVLAADLRHPGAITRTRAALYEIPLYAPPREWPGHRWLSGGGVSHGGALLSAARPSAGVTWADGDAMVSVRTAPRSMVDRRRLPAGIILIEDEPALSGVTTAALLDRLRPVTILVDDHPVAGSLLDLSQEGLGWLAEAPLDDRHVLELAGREVDPVGLPLVRFAVHDLADRPDRPDDDQGT